MSKQFRNNLKFVRSGYEACWRNAGELRESAEILLEKNRFGLSVSVSVLSMEEIGKMFLIDGLLFSRAGDYKATAFSQGSNKHESKLLSLELFPFFVQSLANNDPRYGTYQYNTAIAITLTNFRDEYTALAEHGINTFVELDAWKQKGFYASENGNRIVSPDELITEGLATAVVVLARRLTTTIDFLLEDGNIDRYFRLAEKVRSSFSKEDWEWLDKESTKNIEKTLTAIGMESTECTANSNNI